MGPRAKLGREEEHSTCDSSVFPVYGCLLTDRLIRSSGHTSSDSTLQVRTQEGPNRFEKLYGILEKVMKTLTCFHELVFHIHCLEMGHEILH